MSLTYTKMSRSLNVNKSRTWSTSLGASPRPGLVYLVMANSLTHPQKCRNTRDRRISLNLDH